MIQLTLFNSTMQNSILSLISTRQPGPGIFPYIQLQFHNFYLDKGSVNKINDSLRKTGPHDKFYCILQSLTRENNRHGCFFNVPYYLHVPQYNPPFSTLIIPLKPSIV